MTTARRAVAGERIVRIVRGVPVEALVRGVLAEALVRGVPAEGAAVPAPAGSGLVPGSPPARAGLLRARPGPSRTGVGAASTSKLGPDRLRWQFMGHLVN